jgi:hypothetical protein
MTYSYPINLNIQYSNNNEYRKCVRQVFQMNARNFPDTTTLELDDETEDEMMYDDKSASDMMDFIYEHTKVKEELCVLYSKAASFMFSIDTNIGLTILFGYDYLDIFHSLLQVFFSNPSESTITQSSEYTRLYNKLYSK